MIKRGFDATGRLDFRLAGKGKSMKLWDDVKSVVAISRGKSRKTNFYLHAIIQISRKLSTKLLCVSRGFPIITNTSNTKKQIHTPCKYKSRSAHMLNKTLEVNRWKASKHAQNWNISRILSDQMDRHKLGRLCTQDIDRPTWQNFSRWWRNLNSKHIGLHLNPILN